MTTIVLLGISISQSAGQGNNIPSTGRRDSITVSFDDLRAANAKFIELEYEKKARRSLELVVLNDSIIISNVSNDNKLLRKKLEKADKKNNFFIAGLGATILALVVSLIK